MDTILHALDLAVSPEKAFEAVATGKGLSSWWTTRVDAEERAGGIVRFKFIPDFNPEMEITEMNRPAVVAWRCVGGAGPWQDATIRFDIEARGEGRCLLMFRQRYAVEMPDEAYGTFNYNWGYYLGSLQKYVETGTGTPHSAQ